jgi:hypothetical protein
MPAPRHNSAYWGDNVGYWRQHAERARKRAEQVRERAEYTAHYVSKQRILKLAKRYDQMADLAEERVNKQRQKQCTEL